MKSTILYKSESGCTKQYAQWIEEATGIKAHVLDKKSSKLIGENDLIIIGCSIFAKKPKLQKWLKKHWNLLQDKKVVLFTTSGADPEAMPVSEWINSSLPADMIKAIKVFPLAGKMIFSELSGKHRIMMKIGQMIEKDPEEKKRMIEDADGMDKKNISSLIEYVNSLQKT